MLESLVCMVVKAEEREGILFENSIGSKMCETNPFQFCTFLRDNSKGLYKFILNP